MNILMQDWDLPPFDKIDIADYEPAIEAAIEEARCEVEAIATTSAEPTFANTVEALERADRHLQRVSAILLNLNECCTNDELQQTVMRTEPAMTRFATSVMTDRRLYERVETVYAHERDQLQGEARTLLENTRKSFLRHGVGLQEAEREEYKRNEEELSELKLHFSQNALADTNDWSLHLHQESELDGLPESVCDAAHEEALRRGVQGWVFTLSAPSYIPFMTYSRRRDLREQMYRAYGSIGGRGNKHDNNAIIARIVQLRSRQAALLGYDSYCDYVLDDRMVQSLPRLRTFMHELHEAVLPAARHDLDEMQQLSTEPLMPWDVSFYAEQLKQQRYDLDSEQLRPYFPLHAVKEGIFGLYGRLYAIAFRPNPTAAVYHEEVEVYDVVQMPQETPIGTLYLDMHPRPSKRSGAWMTEFRGQYGHVRPQIQVVCNFSRPTADAPSLLRFSEVETFMHEMGHAMHGLLSEVQYESLSGTNVKRDFVEMPSQLMENWCYEPEFLSTFARHYHTGEPLPADYIDRIRAAQNHLAGWLCLRQLNLGFTDIAFHTRQRIDCKAEDVEAEAMTHLLPRVQGCCTATNFNHIFGGGYASGYYGYKWAEVLDADIFSRFKRDGIFNTATASEFRHKVLSRGGTEHPSLLFEHFMGRQPDPQALLKRMNLI